MSGPKAPKFDIDHVSLLWARPEHASAISKLHATLFDEGWSETAIAKLIDHPGAVGLVATIAGPQNVGGFVLAQVAADEAEILTLGVGREWQRLGVGVHLVEGVKRAAAKAGARALHLEVAQSNAAALRLYEKMGFREAGRRKGYYVRPTGAEDAVLLKGEL